MPYILVTSTTCDVVVLPAGSRIGSLKTTPDVSYERYDSLDEANLAAVGRAFKYAAVVDEVRDTVVLRYSPLMSKDKPVWLAPLTLEYFEVNESGGLDLVSTIPPFPL